MTITVDALLPLSLLEAVRNVDRPEDDLEAELVPELRNKRLGLSDTVYAQIRRYTEAARHHQRTVQDEAAGIARLIGRRPDAEEIFRSAGRYIAARAYQAIPGITRSLIPVLPSFVARPMALNHTRRIADRYMNGSVRRSGGFIILDVPHSATVDSAPSRVGCAFYEEFLTELLRLMGTSVASADHVRCAARGEGSCEWRAEWSAITKARVVARVPAQGSTPNVE